MKFWKPILTTQRSCRTSCQSNQSESKSINQNANRSIHKIDQSEFKSINQYTKSINQNANRAIFQFSFFNLSIFQYFIHQNGAQKRNFDFLEISAHKLNSSLKWHLLTPAPLSFKNNRIV